MIVEFFEGPLNGQIKELSVDTISRFDWQDKGKTYIYIPSRGSCECGDPECIAEPHEMLKVLCLSKIKRNRNEP